jgi:hypothetical protein
MMSPVDSFTYFLCFALSLTDCNRLIMIFIFGLYLGYIVWCILPVAGNYIVQRI